MKKALILIVATLILLAGCATNTNVRKMSFPPLRNFEMPKVEQVKLDNGMKLFLCEDHSYPIVNIDMMFDGGSVYEEYKKRGVAEVLGRLLTEGGSKNYPADSLKQILDINAIGFYSSFSARTGNYAISYLTDTEDIALDIFRDNLLMPAFDEDKLDIIKMQMREEIARRNDSDSDVVFREFSKLIYGADSPYARTNEYDDVNNIERMDLIRFYNAVIHPSRISVSIYGDFNSEEMISKFKENFEQWNPVDYGSFLELPEVPVVMEPSVNYISRPDATQSWILLGHMTEFTQDNPDYFPMIVMNQILGGGFSSRVFKTVRTKLGLAYSPGAYYSTNFEVPGIFYVMSQTKTEDTTQAIDALINEVEKMKTVPVTDLELHQAKESYLNSYVFKYEKKKSIVNTMRTLDVFNYPTDFIQKIKEGVQKVTKEDVERVAKQYLHPDKFTIVVIGDQEGFKNPLSQYGEVNNIDITIPEPTTNQKELTEDMISQGKTIFNDVLSKMGDSRSLKTMIVEGKSTQIQNGTSFDIDYSVVSMYPDKVKRTITAQGVPIDIILNGKSGVRKMMGQNMAMQKSEVESIFKQSYQNLLWISKYRDQYTPYLDDDTVFNGVTYKTLGLRRGDMDYWLLLDENNELKGRVNVFENMGKAYTLFLEIQTTELGTIQTKDETYSEDGTFIQNTSITNMEWNPEVDESIFSVE